MAEKMYHPCEYCDDPITHGKVALVIVNGQRKYAHAENGNESCAYKYANTDLFGRVFLATTVEFSDFEKVVQSEANRSVLNIEMK
ncbi:MAG TPA: hypothetical protein VJI46_04095 [Candidatus Nanoarchaeia archaeon]|nr:hypothetical protein [Candidatus Nanoarchaeia archaeon]